MLCLLSKLRDCKTMNLYYVDCCDQQVWVFAEYENAARAIAARHAGHSDCNECLHWKEVMGLKHLSDQSQALTAFEQVLAALERAKETILR